MQVAWAIITTADLNHYLVAAQVTALRTAALGAGQTDPFNEVMPTVTARIRSICSTNGRVISATANSVPPEVKDIACYLILEELQTRLPGLKLTEEQVRQTENGRDYLKQIARGEAVISDPLDPITPPVQAGGAIKIITSRERIATRETLKGL
jgi:hypothetical protein